MQEMKNKMKRFLAVLLSVLLAGGLIPSGAMTVWAEGAPGSFVLMALSGGQAIIQPTTVQYAAGATIQEALLGSGYSFSGLAEDCWINAVEGVADSYALYYDNEGYDLTVPADTITAIWITGNYEQGYSDALLNLEKLLADYREAGDGRQNYAPLSTAAAAALQGFWSADAAQAQAYCAELQTLTEEYEQLIHGDTRPLTLQVTQAGAAVLPQKCTFTDAYGNETVFENLTESSISLIPGSYTYDITDGGVNHVSGSCTVADSADSVLVTELPSGQWVTDVDLGLKSGWTDPVEKTGTVLNGVYYVPDYAGPALYPYVVNAADVDTDSTSLYFGVEGRMGSGRKNWNAHTQSVSAAAELNALTGSTVTIQAVRSSGEVRQYQEYHLQVLRIPTLKTLSVSAEGTALPLEFDPDLTEYNLSTVTDTVDLTGGLLCADAQLLIDGAAQTDAETMTISLPSSGTKDVTVKVVSPYGPERSYVLHIEKKESAKVQISHASGMTTTVKNAAGAEILPATAGNTVDTYHLTPGETYTWVGTKNVYYHTSGSFTATDGSRVTAYTPITTDWMSNMAAKSTTASTAVSYPFLPDGSGSSHELEVQVGSTRTFFYFYADLADSSCTATASYLNYQGNATEKTLTSGRYINIASLVNQSGKSTSVQITVSKPGSTAGVTCYQDYTLNIRRQMELASMTAATGEGANIVLTQMADGAETSKTGYDKVVYDYAAAVPKATREISITGQFYTSLLGMDDQAVITVASSEGSVELRCDEEHSANSQISGTVSLNPNREQEDVTVTVSHPDPQAVAQTYTIHVRKLNPVVTSITTTPADAVVFLIENLSGERILPEEDGTWLLSDTLSYNYTITAKGYVGIDGSFTASNANKTQIFTLEKAADTEFADISAEDDWSSFRQDETNNGVTSVATPISSEDTVLMWANRIGEGYGSGATGCPILVGGYLYTYAGTSIVKVDKDTGEIVQSGVMAGNSSFAINTPTYADGMIFVALSNGRVQAFNAETLESIWLYTDPLGGQGNCTITYKDGYVYTGFWNGEAKQANFVCISVTDEDPSQTTEAKRATWRYTDKGFYWAGAYATSDFVIVTTDDGESGSTTGHGSIVSLDPTTGRVLDAAEMPCVGDLRSCVTYDPETDSCYFTSKGGYFCKIRVAADGSFVQDSLQLLQLTNGSENNTNVMSSSTPTIYKGRAYVGVSGTGQFTPYSGHNITVIDLASWSIAYTVPTQGYPQTSGLLTTAYEGDTEYVYVYFLDNYTPGKIRVIRDKAGQTAMDPAYTTTETYTVKNQTYEIETAYVLFTPSGQQAQYAICSLIVDADGNIYFKNDSAQLMKLSSTIASLEVTEEPVSIYCKGQTFNPEGLKVTAHYANGSSKDISSYVSCYLDEDFEIPAESRELTAEDATLYICYDLDKMLQGDTSYWKLYHDLNGEAGIAINFPHATLTLDVETEHVDENEDGICDRCNKSVYEPPVITEQPQDVRAGVKTAISYHVTAENAASYQWQYTKDGKKWYTSSASTAKTDTLKITVSTSNCANRYRCMITGQDKSVIYTEAAGIDLIPGAKILTQPVSVTALLGEKISFKIEADHAVTYQWQYSKTGDSWFDSSVASAKTPELQVTTSKNNKNYQYRCKITGEDGNVVTSKTTAFIIITAQPSKSPATVGESAVFSVTAENAAEYQWYYSKDQGATWYKTSVTGATTDTMTIKVSSSNCSNLYRCMITDVRGIKAPTVAVGFAKGLKIVNQPVNVTASVGQKVTFSVKAEEVAEGGYQWYYSKDGSKWYKSGASGNTTDTISLTVSESNKGNQYRCKLTGTDGTTLTTNAVMVVAP